MGASPSAPSVDLQQKLLDNKAAACARAAKLISEADVFLLCTGAGFSADSGLAVYVDVAQVGPYKARGLEYHDICQPSWLQSEPQLFWGFWGQCFNDYRNTAPHEGYAIIDGWADRLFRRSRTAEAMRAGLCERNEQRVAAGCSEGALEPYHVTDFAGAFFAFTSNVDAHHFDWFRACEIRECHGNTEIYQCSNQACTSSGIWRAPVDFAYTVDMQTMLAPDEAPPRSAQEATGDQRMPQTGEDAAKPSIGHVRGGGRSTMLRYMPGPAPDAKDARFLSNHPVCHVCEEKARPAILMFGDYDWNDSNAQELRWNEWTQEVRLQSQSAAKTGSPLRVAMLEIGAGGNVTTVRSTSEQCLERFLDAGAQATLIRVNPDLPLGDRSRFDAAQNGQAAQDLLALPVLSIMGRGLESLRAIDAAMDAPPGGS